MSDIATADSLFFDRTGMDRARVDRLVGDARCTAPTTASCSSNTPSPRAWCIDDGRLKSATFDESQGFGLRTMAGEATGYAHASELSEEAIGRAATAVRAVLAGHSGTLADGPRGTNRALYAPVNPLTGDAVRA